MTTFAPAQQYPNALRAWMRFRGFTAEELATKTGIPLRTLRTYISGGHIRHERRELLSRALGCSLDQLMMAGPMVQYNQQGIWTPPPSSERSDDMILTRRVLLKVLKEAGFGLLSASVLLNVEPFERLFRAVLKPTEMDSETLHHFEQLTHLGWQLSDGRKLEAVEQLLPTYLPALSNFADHPSRHQVAAAQIVAESYQLSYVVASHKEDFTSAQAACEQSRHYAQIARDPNLEAASLIRQGVVALHRKRPVQTLHLDQEAIQYDHSLSPLLRTRLYASLAEVQGKLGQEQDARKSIGVAYESFPAHPEHDPAARYIHFSQSGLFLHQGLALLDLHKPEEALNALLQVDGLKPKIAVSERSRIDFINQQALASVALGDLERFLSYIEAATVSALALGSDLRYSEAWDIYTRGRDVWPDEPRVKSQAVLFSR